MKSHTAQLALGLLILLMTTATIAFKGIVFSSHRRQHCLSTCSTVTDTVTSPSFESIKRQMIINSKPPPAIVVVEDRTISIVAVPSLREIEDAAKISERSVASKTFCSRSGGYPDLDVKDGIYLLLWASMTQNLQNSQALKVTDGNALL